MGSYSWNKSTIMMLVHAQLMLLRPVNQQDLSKKPCFSLYNGQEWIICVASLVYVLLESAALKLPSALLLLPHQDPQRPSTLDSLSADLAHTLISSSIFLFYFKMVPQTIWIFCFNAIRFVLKCSIFSQQILTESATIMLVVCASVYSSSMVVLKDGFLSPSITGST